MARRRRKASTTRRRKVVARATNPRRRRRHARRRNPVIVARSRRRRSSRAVAAAPRRRRRHARRRNPSALHLGQIFKNIVYGTGGAIVTRSAAAIASGFVPGMFAGNPLTGPALQVLIAATVVRWGGKKFLGQQQGDAMMFGGFISAGLDLADRFLPNVQGQLTGMFRSPVQVAPGVAGPAGQLAGYGDVEEVYGFAGGALGMGDVEDVMVNEFNGY